MKHLIIIFTVFMTIFCRSLYAEDKEPKGAVDVTSETAVSVIQKVNAFFQGNLEVTMDSDQERIKNKDNYITNAIGQKVPKTTATKSAKSLHIY